MKMDIDPKCAWRAWDHETHNLYYFSHPDEMWNTMHKFFKDDWSFEVMRVVREGTEDDFVTNHARLDEVTSAAKIQMAIAKDALARERLAGLSVYAGYLLGKGIASMDAILSVFTRHDKIGKPAPQKPILRIVPKD